MALYGNTKAIMALDPIHKLQYHMNDFLASTPGQKLADHKVMDNFPEVRQQIKKQVTIHQKIMDNIAKKNLPKTKG